MARVHPTKEAAIKAAINFFRKGFADLSRILHDKIREGGFEDLFDRRLNGVYIVTFLDVKLELDLVRHIAKIKDDEFASYFNIVENEGEFSVGLDTDKFPREFRGLVNLMGRVVIVPTDSGYSLDTSNVDITDYYYGPNSPVPDPQKNSGPVLGTVAQFAEACHGAFQEIHRIVEELAKRASGELAEQLKKYCNARRLSEDIEIWSCGKGQIGLFPYTTFHEALREAVRYLGVPKNLSDNREEACLAKVYGTGLYGLSPGFKYMILISI